MPEVHFIGTIDSVTGLPVQSLSLTWAIVPRNSKWFIQKGSFFGETHTGNVTEEGTATMNHPIDAQFNTSTSEGWPFLVCEVWDRSFDGSRGFCGCGCVWLPSSYGKHDLEIILWKPTVHKLLSIQKLSDYYIPNVPDLENMREIAINANLRSATKTASIGTVSVTMYTLTTSDFSTYGVEL
mmetsp:Transcript_26380/g.39137  ORF Transcript_26380/g.39137 Transcript_26380/m.39137 type:complete len:182 (-) Transcript_26380:236-781(-)